MDECGSTWLDTCVDAWANVLDRMDDQPQLHTVREIGAGVPSVSIINTSFKLFYGISDETRVRSWTGWHEDGVRCIVGVQKNKDWQRLGHYHAQMCNSPLVHPTQL